MLWPVHRRRQRQKCPADQKLPILSFRIRYADISHRVLSRLTAFQNRPE